jgi:predicted HicB family RNase H-like nuclease
MLKKVIQKGKMKKQLPLKVEEDLKTSLSNEAALDGRSLNNYVEFLLNTHPARDT